MIEKDGKTSETTIRYSFDPLTVESQFRGILERCINRRLQSRHKAKFDSEDVMQSAFRTFFRRDAKGEFVFESESDLEKLLKRITIRKAAKYRRKADAGIRDARKETSLESMVVAGVAADTPAPDADLLVDETIVKVLEGLPEVCDKLLELKVMGLKDNEIIDQLKLTNRTYYRRLKLIRERLEKIVNELENE